MISSNGLARSVVALLAVATAAGVGCAGVAAIRGRPLRITGRDAVLRLAKLLWLRLPDAAPFGRASAVFTAGGWTSTVCQAPSVGSLHERARRVPATCFGSKCRMSPSAVTERGSWASILGTPACHSVAQTLPSRRPRVSHEYVAAPDHFDGPRPCPSERPSAYVTRSSLPPTSLAGHRSHHEIRS